MQLITLIMTDTEDETIPPTVKTFQSDYLPEVIQNISEFLEEGGFVLPGPLTFKIDGPTGDRTYDEILKYYQSSSNFTFNLDM
jgi:hypothetical protein